MSTLKTHWKKMNSKDYSLIKLLITSGAKNSVISKVTGRADQTIAVIKQSKDLEDYRRIIHAFGEKYKKVGVSTSKSLPLAKLEVPSKTKFTILDVCAQLSNINDTLKELRDAWKVQPKKGFFG